MNKQKGLTLVGLLTWGIIIVLGAVFLMRVVPSVLDYYTLKKDAKSVVAQLPKDATVPDVRAAYERFAQIDRLPLSSSELDISKENGQIVIGYAYEKRIHLFANVSLLISYKGSTLD